MEVYIDRSSKTQVAIEGSLLDLEDRKTAAECPLVLDFAAWIVGGISCGFL